MPSMVVPSASVLTVSIGALMLAGIIPGLLIGLAQMATVHAYAKRRGYPTYARATLNEFLRAAAVSIPAMMTPVIIIGGKIFGWFTATESAAIAVLYSLALSAVFYRELGRRQLYDALLETGKLAAIALFCVGTASTFGWLLAYYQVPKILLDTVSSWHLGLVGTGFLVAGVFLIVGCFLDAIPAIIILIVIAAVVSAAFGAFFGGIFTWHGKMM